MENLKYPKILIVGQSFNKNSGGGITMSNLFQDWPKDCIAVASTENLHHELDKSFCEQYYQLGYNGKLHPFPLNILLPKIYCGPVFENNIEKSTLNKSVKPGKYRFIYRYLSAFLKFIGVYYILYRITITESLRFWLNSYNPDIIYSQLSTLELIRFVSEIHTITGKPVAVHMMDDWPVTINRIGPFSSYWGKVIDKEFKMLLDKSSIFMSICEAMSSEYKIRYNKVFIPFHNPIDTTNWVPFTKKDWKKKDRFVILYAGRIGLGVKNSIRDIAKAVEEFSIDYPDVTFEIQTNDISKLRKIVKFNKHIKWVKPIPYYELPGKFSNADLLILPHDFDLHSINFLRFSFSTKVTEYMISGTPVLIYADEQTALAKYALSEEWAYVVTKNTKAELLRALKEIYFDVKLREKLGKRAFNLAIQNEDARMIRENFRKNFILNNS
jgi:glycosyltransferase involved in cell wall biosynthesis